MISRVPGESWSREEWTVYMSYISLVTRMKTWQLQQWDNNDIHLKMWPSMPKFTQDNFIKLARSQLLSQQRWYTYIQYNNDILAAVGVC